MLAYTLLIFVVTLSHLGIGSIIIKSLKIPNENAPFQLIIGLYISLIYAFIIHFFIPLNFVSWLPYLLLGSFYGVKKLLDLRDNISKKVILSFLFVLFFIAANCAYPTNMADTGGYHLPSLKWFSEYPLVKGLTHLHIGLGFGSSSLLLNTVTTGTFFDLNYPKTMNGSITLTWFIFFLFSLLELQKRKISFSSIFMFLTAFIAISPFRIALRGTSTDLGSSIFIILSLYYLIKFLEENNKRNSLITTSLLLATIAFTMKLTAGYFLALIGMIYAFSFISQKKLKDMIVFSLPSTLLLSLLILRNLFLSGCLFFPQAKTCTDSYFLWRVGSEQAQSVMDIIIFYAKYFEAGVSKTITNFSDWSIAWFENMSHYLMPHFKIAISLLILMSLIKFYTKRKKITLYSSIPFFILSLCLGIWFLQAPNIRFGEVYFYLISILIGSEILFDLLTYKPSKIKSVLSLLLLVILLKSHADASFKKTSPFIYSKDKKSLFEKGLVVNDIQTYKPINSVACWDAPLPCSHYDMSKIDFIKDQKGKITTIINKEINQSKQ